MEAATEGGGNRSSFLLLIHKCFALYGKGIVGFNDVYG